MGGEILVSRIMKKTAIGVLLGTLIHVTLGGSYAISPDDVILIYLWSLGSTFSFKHHIDIVLKMLEPGLKLSVISFLTFRNGFMGSVPILVYVTYCLLLGWIHGLLLFIKEIVRIFV